MPFRVVVIDARRGRSVTTIVLDGAPHVGAQLNLPHGQTVVVRHVTVADRDDVAGVIIAGPA